MRIIGNDLSVAREATLVASGTISSGNPIVANNNGTVSSATPQSVSTSIGTTVEFYSGSEFRACSGYDSTNNKIIIAFKDSANSDYGTAKVGTIDPSDNSISFGTASVFESAEVLTEPSGIAHDVTNNKIVIVYRDVGNSNYGTAVVGTVSGTTISFGTPVVFSSSNQTLEMRIAYSTTASKFLIAYRDNGDTDKGKAIVGTVSGTSISFGTVAQFEAGTTVSVGNVYVPTEDKFFISYRDQSDGNSKALMATISGTSVSFGSNANFETNPASFISPVYDSKNDKVVVVYRTGANGGRARVASVDGNTITYGTVADWDNGGGTGGFIDRVVASFDENVGKVVFFYRNKTGSNPDVFARQYNFGEVSGTDITFGTKATIGPDGRSDYFAPVYDANAKRTFVSYEDQSDGAKGKGNVITVGGTANLLTAENYIGIAKSGAADGDGVVVNTQGTVAILPVVNYILSNASYDSKSFSTASQDVTMKAMAFNTDGTKMYLAGTTGDAIYQYSLSTAFDVSTASYDSVSFSVSSQSVFPSAVEFNNDGTKMYVGSSNTNGVFQYSLSSAFDLSTASYDSVSFDPSTQETNVQGIQFNNDGTKLYIIGTANNTVFQYSLSTGFDLSTASYDSVSFSVASQSTNSHGLEFNNDGTKLFVCDVETDTIYQYDLTTGFDLSTASYSNISFDVSSQDFYPAGMSFNSDGSKMYIVGDDSNYIYQYSTAGNSLTAGQSYYVQTDGTLSTTAGTPSVFAGTAVGTTKLIVKG